MLATVQRVSGAQVRIEDKIYSEIGLGLLIFVCIEKEDSIKSITAMVTKIINFRMLDGPKGSTAYSLKDANEDALVISQFTLAAITAKGNKPSFHKSAKPKEAKLLYDKFMNLFETAYGNVKQGKFGAFMEISLINKGPVTFNFKT
ncbi:D-aminoacyl-tRNA deacylase [Gammaproteobacteria bacterium]|nr:D-aminoacyl-tRNA deacylase [Gammaproteobacteria bacterium]